MATSWRTANALLKALRAPYEAAKAARAAELKRAIETGPPPGSSITREAWRDWHEYGFVVCPRTKTTCVDPICGMGVSCLATRAIGLAGDGAPLKRKLRPQCGAKNRQGRPCAVRVEPGKARCRFHGGLSTGPRTAAGKARIAAAQRRRWALRRQREQKPL